MSDKEPYPGRIFVATVDCHPITSFSERMDRLITLMKEAGFDAECPGCSSGMSGILVPMTHQTEARTFLRGIRLDWITAWVSEAENPQAQLFGWYEEKEPNQSLQPTGPSARG